MDRVRNLLEFETVSRFLLAAQYRKAEINPLDYIYSALGCLIRPLEVSDDDVLGVVLMVAVQSNLKLKL
jgi:hypothetical protein